MFRFWGLGFRVDNPQAGTKNKKQKLKKDGKKGGVVAQIDLFSGERRRGSDLKIAFTDLVLPRPSMVQRVRERQPWPGIHNKRSKHHPIFHKFHQGPRQLWPNPLAAHDAQSFRRRALLVHKIFPCFHQDVLLSVVALNSVFDHPCMLSWWRPWRGTQGYGKWNVVGSIQNGCFDILRVLFSAGWSVSLGMMHFSALV